MKVLVLNAGSSSLKFQLIDTKKKNILLKGQLDAIGSNNSQLWITINGKKSEISMPTENHDDAIDIALKSLTECKVIKSFEEIDAIGHRVVHGGEYYAGAVLIDNLVIKRIEELSSLAPLHNPSNLKGILACRKLLPKVKQIAVFDTAFHESMPERAYLYGIPPDLYNNFKIRKYGFHGTSHKYLANEASKLLRKKNSKIITCHLGNGSSITAVRNGKSIDTSMGFTPLAGVMMGTRSGSIDPAIILFLISKGIRTDEIDHMLNKKSGFLGVFGNSDMREIYAASRKKDRKALLTIDMYSYQIASYIGSYVAALDGVDAIVFSAGLGENAFYVRKNVCSYFSHLGLKLDDRKNERCEVVISDSRSKVKVFVIPTNEEMEIALETEKVLKKK